VVGDITFVELLMLLEREVFLAVWGWVLDVALRCAAIRLSLDDCLNHMHVFWACASIFVLFNHHLLLLLDRRVLFR